MLLAEEFVLLSMDDETGQCLLPESTARKGVATALALELLLRRAVRVRHQVVQRVATTSTGDPLLDRAAVRVDKVVNTAAVRELSEADLLPNLLTRLVDRGVLHDAEIWSPGVHLPRDERPEHEVRRRMHAVLVDRHRPTKHDAALIALLEHLRVTSLLLPWVAEDPVVAQRARGLTLTSDAMEDLQPPGSRTDAQVQARGEDQFETVKQTIGERRQLC